MYASVLTPVDRTPFGALSAGMREGCRRVFERTGVRAFLDRKCGIVIFGYGDTTSKVELLDITVPVKRTSGAPAGFDPILDKFTVDEVCQAVWVSRIDWEHKARWLEQRQRESKYESDRETDAMLTEQTRGIMDRMRFESDKLHQGRHYRRTVTV